MSEYTYPRLRTGEPSFDYVTSCETAENENRLKQKAEAILADWLVRLFFPIGSSPPPIVRSAALDYVQNAYFNYRTFQYGRNRPGYAIALYDPRSEEILLPNTDELGAPQRTDDFRLDDGRDMEVGVITAEKNRTPFITDSDGYIFLEDGLTIDEAVRWNKSDAWQIFCQIVKEEQQSIEIKERQRAAALLESLQDEARKHEEGHTKAPAVASLLAVEETVPGRIVLKRRAPKISSTNKYTDPTPRIIKIKPSSVDKEARKRHNELKAADAALVRGERRVDLLQERMNRWETRLKRLQYALRTQKISWDKWDRTKLPPSRNDEESHKMRVNSLQLRINRAVVEKEKLSALVAAAREAVKTAENSREEAQSAFLALPRFAPEKASLEKQELYWAWYYRHEILETYIDNQSRRVASANAEGERIRLTLQKLEEKKNTDVTLLKSRIQILNKGLRQIEKVGANKNSPSRDLVSASTRAINTALRNTRLGKWLAFHLAASRHVDQKTETLRAWREMARDALIDQKKRAYRRYPRSASLLKNLKRWHIRYEEWQRNSKREEQQTEIVRSLLKRAAGELKKLGSQSEALPDNDEAEIYRRKAQRYLETVLNPNNRFAGVPVHIAVASPVRVGDLTTQMNITNYWKQFVCVEVLTNRLSLCEKHIAEACSQTRRSEKRLAIGLYPYKPPLSDAKRKRDKGHGPKGQLVEWKQTGKSLHEFREAAKSLLKEAVAGLNRLGAMPEQEIAISDITAFRAAAEKLADKQIAGWRRAEALDKAEKTAHMQRQASLQNQRQDTINADQKENSAPKKPRTTQKQRAAMRAAEAEAQKATEKERQAKAAQRALEKQSKRKIREQFSKAMHEERRAITKSKREERAKALESFARGRKPGPGDTIH